jgi:hypothetical protein
MIKIDFVGIINSIDWKYVLDNYSFYIVIGAFILFMATKWLFKKIFKKGGKKKMDPFRDLAGMSSQIKENMVRARMKEIQVQFNDMQAREYAEYQAMQERHTAMKADLNNEWDVLQEQLNNVQNGK